MFFSDPANPERDVLVTGIGLVTPLGIGSDVSFRQLLSGATAGRLLTPDDIDHFHELQALLKRVPGGAPADASAARDFVQEYLRTEGTPVLRHHRGKPLSAGVADDEDLLNIITMAAAAEAVQQSGLSTAHLQTEIAGCVIGTSKASLRSLETRHLLNFADSPLQAVRRLWALAGPAFSPVAACATGLVSVLHGSLLIHSGACEICLVGSADASVRASVLASFHRLGVTSNHPDPATA
ncbi:MAG: hypothetical protein KDA89_24900, partial [Planctomycetaceae bacterium]|nr:hypothetical protein [Planctomycetaceae bacterium]